MGKLKPIYSSLRNLVYKKQAQDDRMEGGHANAPQSEKTVRQNARKEKIGQSGILNAFPSENIDFSKGIFLGGFARGGTTWSRRVLAAHPEIFEVPGQVEFHNLKQGISKKTLARKLSKVASAKNSVYELPSRFVTKSPANSVVLPEMLTAVPEAKFLYIIRDPRDVLISYQRTGAQWTDQQSSFDAAMGRTRRYFEGFAAIQDSPSVHSFKYEDLHQDFKKITSEIFDFLGVSRDDDIVQACLEETDFGKATGRQHQEKQGHMRKGVVGDWANYLTYSDAERFKSDPFWAEMMADYGYDWNLLSGERLLRDLVGRIGNGAGQSGSINGFSVILSIEGADWTYPLAVRDQFTQAIDWCQKYQIDYALGFPVTTDDKILSKVKDVVPNCSKIVLIEDAASVKEKNADTDQKEQLEKVVAFFKQVNAESSFYFMKDAEKSGQDDYLAEIEFEALNIHPLKEDTPLIEEKNGSLLCHSLDACIDLRNLGTNTPPLPAGLTVMFRPAAVSIRAPLTLGFRR
ncbi:MAG: sulfotransferase domain-containing protein [Sneathiellales bacterium]|nr:sulfotransferase domain-containing protein [Sneathiellales bacterium]